jgi:predicted HTH domain antitoxin
MQITVELPDDLAQQLIPAGQNPERAVLENVALEAFRAHRLSEHQLAQLLGMDRYQLDGFLKERASGLTTPWTISIRNWKRSASSASECASLFLILPRSAI